MKIVLTATEAKNIVQKHFGIGSSFDLEILAGDPNLAAEAEKVLARMSAFVVNGVIPPSSKIPAIKELRSLVPNPEFNPLRPDGMPSSYIGLAQAKLTVENWPAFVKKVQTLGRLPRIVNHEWAE